MRSTKRVLIAAMFVLFATSCGPDGEVEQQKFPGTLTLHDGTVVDCANLFVLYNGYDGERPGTIECDGVTYGPAGYVSYVGGGFKRF